MCLKMCALKCMPYMYAGLSDVQGGEEETEETDLSFGAPPEKLSQEAKKRFIVDMQVI